MSDRRRIQGATVFAILAALERISADALAGSLPPALEYKVEPLNLDVPLPDDAVMSSTFALADLFADSQAEPNLVLIDKINSLIAESQQELDKYVAEYHDLYGEPPPAVQDDLMEDAFVEFDEPDLTVAEKVSTESVLPGLGDGPMRTPDIEMTDDGQISVNTGMLPTTEVDPRTSTYKSDNEALQQVLDQVAVVDAQVPESIRSTATDVYNKVIENGQP